MMRSPWLSLAWLVVLAAACEGPAQEPVTLAPAPARTAAQDRALRAMAMDLAEANACVALRDRFVPVPEERPGSRETPAIVEGRLWVDACSVERRGDRLAMHVGGRGWQWVSRSGAGPLGSSFTVHGTVRFEATLDLEGELDLRYDEGEHRASIALTPSSPPRARVVPIGSVPVRADGGWSSVLGGIGSLLGSSPEAQARAMVEDEAATRVRRMLSRGATLSVDLCTSQLDGSLGARADDAAPPPRPWPADEHLFLDNARARVHAGALDLIGPFATDGAVLHVELEVEEGEAADVAIVCRAEAALVASAFLAGSAPRAGAEVRRERAVRGRPVALSVQPDECADPHVLVTPSGASEHVTYRYRVRRDGQDAEARVRCD